MSFDDEFVPVLQQWFRAGFGDVLPRADAECCLIALLPTTPMRSGYDGALVRLWACRQATHVPGMTALRTCTCFVLFV